MKQETNMGSMSVMHWVIVLLIILLVFGTKKLTGAGSDLGKAFKNFKDEINGEPEKHNSRLIDVAPTENKEQVDNKAQVVKNYK